MHLYKKIIRNLIKDSITISTAESCTGGLLAYSITKNKDSSKIYKGGYITYSNELKIKNLNVKKTTIKKQTLLVLKASLQREAASLMCFLILSVRPLESIF